MATSGRHWEQDKEATVYVGNLDERVTDALVWELMLQAGRIVNVHLPKDRVSQLHQGYGFVEFISEQDADYAARIMNQIRLYGKPIRVNKASADKSKTTEVGAELYVGNLHGMVDERVLYECFQQFGPLVAPPKVARDDTNVSKGYGFVSYATFEASDTAIQEMDGQYLMNQPIRVQYAFKKDGKGERHGDEAERRLAEQAKQHGVEPTREALPAFFTAPPTPVAAAMPPVNGVPNGPPAGFGMNGSYGAMPPQRPPSVPNQPLPPPPPGLPTRPPMSQAGYGGPAPGMVPPGFAPQMPGYPPQHQQPPPGFGAPPGFPIAPPGFAPPGQPQMPYARR